MPKDLVAKGLVEAAFKVEAENEKYPLFQKKDIGDGAAENGDYFRVWIWRPRRTDPEKSTEIHGDDSSEGTGVKGGETSLILPLSASFRFDLQFGRRVMAKLLRLENRANWRDCGQSEAEEMTDAEAFKKAFKEFDFSLEE